MDGRAQKWEAKHWKAGLFLGVTKPTCEMPAEDKVTARTKMNGPRSIQGPQRTSSRLTLILSKRPSPDACALTGTGGSNTPSPPVPICVAIEKRLRKRPSRTDFSMSCWQPDHQTSPSMAARSIITSTLPKTRIVPLESLIFRVPSAE